MSIFGTIMSKVFGASHAAAAPSASPASGAAAPSTAGAAPSPAPSAGGQPSGGQQAGAQQAGGQQVDVAAVLDGMESHAGQTLNWRQSIVDLLKLLGMDSSLTARKELAHELGYTGSTDDSASMNIWLHKEVMGKFAANGGKLPDDLKHA